ncbi:polycystin-2-like isoform X2 [Sitophilus oryzae]|uniref:Polycystin-2-like isoform X2 n=1 Tax=Sitophilus oryzae TaxID=7048 RepID=A0A6J2XSH3_SITOR|nr:polycystin-2-like isoform X2 [Sitophilus oryzae]
MTKTSRYIKRINFFLAFWITTAIAAEIGREELLGATFRDIVLHIISLLFLSIYIFSQISVSEYYITTALKNSFDIDEDGDFFKIISAEKFWEFLEEPLTDALYKTRDSSITDTESMYMLNENRVLGVPRMRQVKVKSNSCQIHGYFRRLFVSCYSLFSNIGEDRESFGLKSGTAWVYSDADKTESLSYSGTLSTYTGGGFYVDFSTDKNDTEDLIGDLKENLWVTRGTRAVFIDFSIYNSNLNLFCICKLVFEFLPSGDVKPNFKFSPATLLEFQDWRFWTLRFLLYLFGIYIIFCLFEEFREIIYFGWNYLAQFWTYIDLSVIVLAFMMIFGTEYMRIIVPSYLEKIKNKPTAYGNLEYPEVAYSTFKVIGALLLFFVYIRTFKYLNFNKRMAQLNDTIKQCSKDIMGFSVMFFVAYFAYAELGYLVFGSEVKSYSTFGFSMFTLLRTILGDFDFEEIHKANWIVAPIYFLSFIILVFFVLLNMFLAIINDTYSDVKTDIAIAPKEMELIDYLEQGFKRILLKLGCRVRTSQPEREPQHNTNINKIRDALVKCKFEEREIQMYFTRYEIDPLKELKKKDIDSFFEKLALEDEAKKAEQQRVVKWQDFQRQDAKLIELERSLATLGQRVQELLTTIENIQGAKKKT